MNRRLHDEVMQFLLWFSDYINHQTKSDIFSGFMYNDYHYDDSLFTYYRLYYFKIATNYFLHVETDWRQQTAHVWDYYAKRRIDAFKKLIAQEKDSHSSESTHGGPAHVIGNVILKELENRGL